MHCRLAPYLNRFIQPDTIIPSILNPQSWNRFSYVLNRPLVFVDPTGHLYCSADLEADECNFIDKTYKKTLRNSNLDGLINRGRGGGGFGAVTAPIQPKGVPVPTTNPTPDTQVTPPVTTTPSPTGTAAMATVLDTGAALLNGGYAVVGDLVGLVCQGCYGAVIWLYGYYSFIPNCPVPGHRELF